MHNAIKSFKTGAISQACKNCLHIVKADTQFAYMYKYMLYIQQKKLKMKILYNFNSIFLCTSLLKLREECQFDRFFLKRDM